MNTIKFSFLGLLCVGLLFQSCDKNEATNNVLLKTNEKVNQNLVKTRSQGNTYEFSQYKYQIEHFCQMFAGPKGPHYDDAEGVLSKDVAGTACNPTSYMMAANCIAKYHGKSYDFSSQTLKKIINGIDSYTSLTSLSSYVNSNKENKDCTFLRARFYNETNREKVKDLIEDALLGGGLVLVNINADVYNFKKVNNDIFFDGNSPDMQYYFSYEEQYVWETNKKDAGPYTYGHIILLMAIDKWSTGNGMVSYFDPLHRTRGYGGMGIKDDGYGKYSCNVKPVLYSRLLNSMKNAGASAGRYTFLVINYNE